MIYKGSLLFSMCCFRSFNRCCAFICRFLFICRENIENGNRSLNAYRKITSVRSCSFRLNVHDPRNDLKRNGPFVILIAVTFGRLKETYSVSIPNPFFATHQALTPGPAWVAPPANIAFPRKVSKADACRSPGSNQKYTPGYGL